MIILIKWVNMISRIMIKEINILIISYNFMIQIKDLINIIEINKLNQLFKEKMNIN